MPTFRNTLSFPSSYLSAYEDETERSETSAYKIQTPGELPRRKHRTYRTRRKFEIKKASPTSVTVPGFGRICENYEKLYWLRHFRPSARLSAWNSSVPTGRIVMKFDSWVFFENLPRKFKFHWNLPRITGTLPEHRYIFLTISRPVLLRMKKVSGKSCRETREHTFCVQ